MRLDEAGFTLDDLDLGGIDAESDYRLSQYFVTTPYVRSALAGRRTLILGRKGSGKSALYTQLPRLLAENGHGDATFLGLTPDQYSWSSLCNYKEQGLHSDQAHMNAWRLTIAIELASHLVSLPDLWVGQAAEAVSVLKRFLKDNFGTLKPGMRNSTAAVLKGLEEFSLSAFGFGGTVRLRGTEKQPVTPNIVDAIFDQCALALDQVAVLLAFDRLDDCWDGSPEAQSLIVGLVKAAKDLNDRLQHDWPSAGLRVLVCLRSDIYDVVRFDDKDKHRPTEQHVSWSAAELKDMLERRLPDGVAPEDLFESGDMRGSAPFNYIIKRTFLRPREVLQFVDQALSESNDSETFISKDSIRAAESRYSRWKVADLKQEFMRVYPALSDLLECLRQEKHRYDSLSDLSILIEAKAPSLLEEYGARNLLEQLFDASVIGIRSGNSGSARFKAEDSDLVMPAAGSVYIHQSLVRGLSITEARKKVTELPSPPPEVQSHDQVTIALLQVMLTYLPIQDLAFFDQTPRPLHVLRAATFKECADGLGFEIVVDVSVSAADAMAAPNRFSRQRFEHDSREYTKLRQELLKILSDNSLSVGDYEAAAAAR